MSRTWLIICMGLTMTLPVSAEERCILPGADGNIETPSPPNLEGVIASVAGMTVGIRLKDQSSTGQTRTIYLVPKTELFTVYGGYVSPSQLLAGQHVKVWLKECRQKAGKHRQEAAVVELASKKPGEDFP